MPGRACPHCGQPLGPIAPRFWRRWERRQWTRFAAGAAPILLGLLLAILYAPPAFAVHVSGMRFASPDDACAMNLASAPGFNTSIGAILHASLTLRTLGSTRGCDLRGINVTTPGFSISATDLPLATSGETNLTFLLHVPDRPYSGPLTFEVR